jgi:hypothetical protein
MSGGHWEYNQHNVRELCDEVARDKYAQQVSQRITKLVGNVGEVLYDIIHDLDWHISGDATIHDPKDFERVYLYRLKDALKLYPKGKKDV